jgi:hypothetical protein
MSGRLRWGATLHSMHKVSRTAPDGVLPGLEIGERVKKTAAFELLDRPVMWERSSGLIAR